MKKLLDRLDYIAPGMEETGRLHGEGSLEGTMKAMTEHFRTHTSPAYLFNAEETKTSQDDEVLMEAQEVMDHKTYGHQFPEKIE